ncbi:hypothetical protein HNR46_004232 [Haloferula luteola]|uniref:Uncharacterized protein n=1 Tax=Haloferula luteola TaxID=595692 RepID=A0A840VMX1_9BACT|nr:hypothetical protein [Haloferula luteola]
MARRRELKSIASGLAWHCLSRNNDVNGYWGVGVICLLAQKQGCGEITVPIFPRTFLSESEAEFRDQLTRRLADWDYPLKEFVVACSIRFSFEPHSVFAPRGQRYRVTCSAILTDDLGKQREASAHTLCFPHNPAFELQSTRANKSQHPTA